MKFHRTSITPLPMLLSSFLLVSFPSLAFSWSSIPQTDPKYQRQFQSNFQIKIPPSRQAQTDGFYSDSTSSGTEGDSIYTLYNYQNLDYDRNDIKKVVIQIAGQGRDSWSYFDDTLNALKNATARDEDSHRDRDKARSSSSRTRSETRSSKSSSTRTSAQERSSTSTSSTSDPTSIPSSPTDQDSDAPTLKESDVLIFCPMFMNLEDAGAYPISNPEDPFSSTSSALVWNANEWMFGGDSILPNDYFWSGDQDEEENEISKRDMKVAGSKGFKGALINKRQESSNPPPGISSFEVMDELVRYFSDSANFPNLQTIIIAGHSAGGQYVQRYALVGAVPSSNIPVHFTVMNPGSFSFLTNWRARNSDPSNIYTNKKNESTVIAPVVERSSNNTCPEFNDWKYGIGLKASDEVLHQDHDLHGDGEIDFGEGDGRGYDQRYLGEFVKESLNEDNSVGSIVLRYGERIVHYLYGTADHGVGSSSCEAFTQGIDHISRGLNFIRHLTELKSFENLRNDVDPDDQDYIFDSKDSNSTDQNKATKTQSTSPSNLSEIPVYMRDLVSRIGPGNGLFPQSQTVDYVPGVQHNPREMFLSKQGLQRLFFINLSGEELPSAVGDSDKDAQYFYPSSGISDLSRSSPWIGVLSAVWVFTFFLI